MKSFIAISLLFTSFSLVSLPLTQAARNTNYSEVDRYIQNYNASMVKRREAYDQKVKALEQKIAETDSQIGSSIAVLAGWESEKVKTERLKGNKGYRSRTRKSDQEFERELAGVKDQIQEAKDQIEGLEKNRESLEKELEKLHWDANNSQAVASDHVTRLYENVEYLERKLKNAHVTEKLDDVGDRIADAEIRAQVLKLKYDQGLIGSYVKMKIDEFKDKELCNAVQNKCNHVYDSRRGASGSTSRPADH